MGLKACHAVAVGAEARELRVRACEELLQPPPLCLPFPLSPPQVSFDGIYAAQRLADLLHSRKACQMELVEREASCRRLHPFPPFRL